MYKLSEIQECRYCACFNLRKAARSITQVYDSAFQSLDLRSTQFSVLAIAKIRGTLSISELAEQMVIDRTTLTRNLGPLVKRGLIRLQPGPDRRTKMITVTQNGILLLDRAFPIWREVQHSVVTRYGDIRFKALLGELREFTKSR